MDPPRPLTRIKYTLLEPTPAHSAGQRRTRARRLAVRALMILLVVGLPLHALANSTHEVGPVHVVPVALDRDFERSFVWRGTVQLAAPASTWVWPTLYFEGKSIGDTQGRVALPELRYEAFVEGERLRESGFGGDFGAAIAGRDVYGCKPRSACEWPELSWGVREVDVEIRASLVHRGDAAARGLTYEYTLGPMEVVLDRCPCW